MAPIKIEDLPVAEGLTPVQEALIPGAGLRSFGPTREGLEDRQPLASHLAAALPLKPPVLDPAHVSTRQLRNTTVGEAPQLAQGQQLRSGLVGAFSRDEDGRAVLSYVSGLFSSRITKDNRFCNKWRLSEITSQEFKVSGNEIHIFLHLKSGWVFQDDVKVTMVFRPDGRVVDGKHQYNLVIAEVNWVPQYKLGIAGVNFVVFPRPDVEKLVKEVWDEFSKMRVEGKWWPRTVGDPVNPPTSSTPARIAPSPYYTKESAVAFENHLARELGQK